MMRRQDKKPKTFGVFKIFFVFGRGCQKNQLDLGNGLVWVTMVPECDRKKTYPDISLKTWVGSWSRQKN